MKLPQGQGEIMKKKLAGLFLIGIWILLFLGGAAYAAEDPLLEAGFFRPNETIMAPSFSLNSVEGIRVNLEHFKHRVVLLFFWTTW